MLGSLITRPVRFATRLTWWGARTSLEVASEVLGLVLGRHDHEHDDHGHDDHPDHDDGGGGTRAAERPEPAAWRGPGASSTSAPADSPAEPRTSAPAEPRTRAPADPRTSAAPGRTGSAPASAPRSAGRTRGPSARRTASAPPVNGAAAAAPPATEEAADAEPVVDAEPVLDAEPAVDTEPAVDAEPVVDAEPIIDDPALRPVAPVDYDAPAPPVAGHVSEEPELVDEVADPGAEDGAGAQVRIGEPWEGYSTMKAAEIVDRIASASREELAAVELYEMAGRHRKSVLAAAQRALKRASPPR